MKLLYRQNMVCDIVATTINNNIIMFLIDARALTCKAWVPRTTSEATRFIEAPLGHLPEPKHQAPQASAWLNADESNQNVNSISIKY